MLGTHIYSCSPLLLLIRYIPFGLKLLGRSTRCCTRLYRIWHGGYGNAPPISVSLLCAVRLSQYDGLLGSWVPSSENLTSIRRCCNT